MYWYRVQICGDDAQKEKLPVCPDCPLRLDFLFRTASPALVIIEERAGVILRGGEAGNVMLVIVMLIIKELCYIDYI